MPESPARAATGALVSHRQLRLILLATGIAVGAAGLAEVLTALISLFTGLAFHGRVMLAGATPVGHHLGAWVILVPVAGAVLVGIMARYGSPAIRGHGIPEVMERILLNESRIHPRLTLLKPLSTAISIGTGGPFGAEGPIIASGGALGSAVGQAIRVTADERKVLLAAGAAAGMAATFGAPVSAVLLAVELLLFEYRSRSLVPVAFAAAAATSVRYLLHGTAAVFAGPLLGLSPTIAAVCLYALVGAVVGFLAVTVTRALYRIEDGFDRLPIHWMWWPAIGAVAVGLAGWVEPRALGVGYANISDILNGSLTGRALIILVVAKLIAWLIALGSGTAGGTLAPLFTIGGGAGFLATAGLDRLFPSLALDPRVGAMVGMAAMFTGASRAMLTSVVFAFEVTHQPLGLLPLLAGCAAAQLISLARMKETIMTERLARRGIRVVTEYQADHLAGMLVQPRLGRPVVTLQAEASAAAVRGWLMAGADGASHQGFPVVDAEGRLVGVLTRRDLLAPAADDDRPVRRLITRPAVSALPSSSLREVADLMVLERVGRVPIVAPDGSGRVVGILSRSDLLEAHAGRLAAGEPADPTLRWPLPSP